MRAYFVVGILFALAFVVVLAQESEKADCITAFSATDDESNVPEQCNAQVMDDIAVDYENAGDLQNAMLWLRRAGNAGSVFAQQRFATIVLNGIAPGSADEAVEMLKKAVAQNSYEAMVLLGLCYHSGVSVKKDLNEALNLFSTAARAGSADGAYHAGSILIDEGSKFDNENFVSEGLKLVQAASNANHNAAMFSYAVMIGNGLHGLPTNTTEALRLCVLAGEQGNPQAMSMALQMVSQGMGVEKNDTLAQYWAEKASAVGNVAAMLYAAESYILGRGVERDPAKAREYLQKATAGGSSEAATALGILQQASGELTAAIDAFKQSLAINVNDSVAHYFLGKLYTEEATRDYEFGLEHLKKAVELGHPESLKLLGDYYREGYGMPQDYTEAHKWYNVASALGDNTARTIRNEIAQQMDSLAMMTAQRGANNWFLQHKKKKIEKS